MENSVILEHTGCAQLALLLTVRATIVHQNDLLQQVLWCVGDDTSYCPLNDRQSLIYVDQHHTDAGQVSGIILHQTPKLM